MLSDRGKQVRRDALKIGREFNLSHYGGSFSCAEIMIMLFDQVLKKDDVFLLSKAHACLCYYVLLRERGLNPKVEVHPRRDVDNGIIGTFGSLGHGFPFGIGVAWAKKLKKEPGWVIVLMGDSELQEGTTWESLLLAQKLKLGNLIVIVDDNGIQGSDKTNDVLSIQPVWDVAEEIGWIVTRSIPGNILFNIQGGDKPSLYHPKTVKGAGVSFMQNDPAWHSHWMNDDEYLKAMEELQ